MGRLTRTVVILVAIAFADPPNQRFKLTGHSLRSRHANELGHYALTGITIK